MRYAMHRLRQIMNRNTMHRLRQARRGFAQSTRFSENSRFSTGSQQIGYETALFPEKGFGKEDFLAHIPEATNTEGDTSSNRRSKPHKPAHHSPTEMAQNASSPTREKEDHTLLVKHTIRKSILTVNIVTN
jgi:hypothetical protein